MSIEFPPVIIDSSVNFEGRVFAAAAPGVEMEAEPASLNMRGLDTDSVDKSGRLTIEPSEVQLYLIMNNVLIHKGTYRSEALQLIYGEGEDESAMKVGGPSMSMSADDVDARGVVQRPATRVRQIRVPDEESPLQFGVDYLNFIVIVTRKG